MKSLSEDRQVEVIASFNSTSRFLDNLSNIETKIKINLFNCQKVRADIKNVWAQQSFFCIFDRFFQYQSACLHV